MFVGAAEKLLVKAALMNVEGIEHNRMQSPINMEDFKHDENCDKAGQKIEAKGELKVIDISEEGYDCVEGMQHALKRKK